MSAVPAYCRRNYFDHTDGFVFVIDSSDKKRLQETADELVQLLQVFPMLLLFCNAQKVIPL